MLYSREGDLDRILKSVKSDGFHTILEMSPALNLTRDKQYVFELGRIVVSHISFINTVVKI